jgi:hypothetical protein
MWCRAEGSKPLPMSFEAPQAVETACDECAGDGQLAYDLEATMWVPAPQPRTGPPTTASGSVCSTACNATAPARCGSIRDAAILRRDPAGNSARACGVPYDDRRLAQVDHREPVAVQVGDLRLAVHRRLPDSPSSCSPAPPPLRPEKPRPPTDSARRRSSATAIPAWPAARC